MKHIIIAIVILVVGVGLVLEGRYKLVVQSPIVARIDKLTGDVWIANSGVWRKINMPPQEKPAMSSQSASQAQSKAK